MGDKTAIPELNKALEHKDPFVRCNAAILLSELGEESNIPLLLNHSDYVLAKINRLYDRALKGLSDPKLLVVLWSYYKQKAERVILEAINSIQANSKFYNYEVWQTHLAAQKADRSNNQNRDPNIITIQTLERLTIMTDKAPIFNQQHATIGVNYAAEGSNVEFTQHTSSSEQTFEILLTDYQQFIQQLQQKYSTVADPTTVPQIIEVEAKLIEAQDHHRWQNFLNLKRLWNGSKKASVKVGEHFAENNVWAKGAIAFLEGVSEDGK
jgi:uncharacterized protein (UPF0147 family)